MSDSKFTRGPWITMQLRDQSLIELVSRRHKPIFETGIWGVWPEAHTERLPIAVVDKGDDHDDATRIQAEDDARLIAAAPELLEALKALTHLMQEAADEIDTDARHPMLGYGGRTVRENIHEARAAIAKTVSQRVTTDAL